PYFKPNPGATRRIVAHHKTVIRKSPPRPVSLRNPVKCLKCSTLGQTILCAMTSVMNLSRLTYFHSDSGADSDEGEAGKRTGDGITGEGYVSSPLLTKSPVLSFVFDSGAPGGWDETTRGYAQLS